MGRKQFIALLLLLLLPVVLLPLLIPAPDAEVAGTLTLPAHDLRTVIMTAGPHPGTASSVFSAHHTAQGRALGFAASMQALTPLVRRSLTSFPLTRKSTFPILGKGIKAPLRSKGSPS